MAKHYTDLQNNIIELWIAGKSRREIADALAVSGQNTGRFVFEGFLPHHKRLRAQRLAALATEQRTILLYEAPHKLLATLNDLAAAFGGVRPLTICRELTKLHEEIWITTLEQARLRYAETTPKGEFVLVLAGAVPADKVVETVTLEDAAKQALALGKKKKLPASEAAKRLAKATGHSKSAIYKTMQEIQINWRNIEIL